MAEDPDQFCERILKRGKSAEALAWARASRADDIRTVGERDPRESLSIIQKLYDLGAKEVIAAEIDVEQGFGQTTNTLIVALPEDKSTRERLFHYEASHAQELGYDPVEDCGQRLMLLWWT